MTLVKSRMFILISAVQTYCDATLVYSGVVLANSSQQN